MEKRRFWCGLLVLLFGMTAAGYSQDSTGGNTDAKTLVVTGIPQEVYDNISFFERVGGPNVNVIIVAFPEDDFKYLAAPYLEMSNFTGSVPYTLSILFHPGSYGYEWAESEFYNVRLSLGHGSMVWEAEHISFASATVTVEWSKFAER